MFRTVLVVVIASMLGIALGKVQARLATSGTVERFKGAVETTAEQKGEYSLATATGNPRMEVDGGSEFQFGNMQHGSSMSHDFVVRNVGDGPLNIEEAGSTCKCTVGKMKSNVLQPGEQTTITLTWTARAIMPNFAQTATFRTNDPMHSEVQFTVRGLIIDSFVIEPRELALGDFPTTEGTKATFHVFTYLEESKGLKNFKWSHPDTRKLVSFDSKVVPIDSERFPQHAKAFLAHEVTVQIAPGMQLGSVNSRISFETDMDEEVGELELLASGRVISDLSLVGGSMFDPRLNVLKLGTLPSGEGIATTVWIAVQGDQRDSIELELDNQENSGALHVTMGEAKIVGKRKMIPLLFEVPKGAPEVYYPGTSTGTFAKVVIKTNHELIQELPIYVRLVVTK